MTLFYWAVSLYITPKALFLPEFGKQSLKLLQFCRLRGKAANHRGGSRTR